jgi:hypothetical protein
MLKVVEVALFGLQENDKLRVAAVNMGMRVPTG